MTYKMDPFAKIFLLSTTKHMTAFGMHVSAFPPEPLDQTPTSMDEITNLPYLNLKIGWETQMTHSGFSQGHAVTICTSFAPSQIVA